MALAALAIKKVIGSIENQAEAQRVRREDQRDAKELSA